MKKALFSLALLLTFTAQATTAVQTNSAFRVVKVEPYNQVVPGEIVGILVEGLSAGPPSPMLSSADFQIEITQDTDVRQAAARTLTSTLIREPGGPPTPGGATADVMRPYLNISFVVPQGLRAGEATLVLSFKGERSNALKLEIVDKPLRPVLGSVAIKTVNPASLPPPPPRGMAAGDLGWRLERGSKVDFHLRPLVDPEDSTSAVLVRFKQGDTYYDATATVVHQPQRTESRGRGMSFLPARDILEVEVPAALTMGEAEVEVRLRANGQTSEAATTRALITDATRSVEAPAANSPRLLAATPKRVGVGQALMLSVDHLRTLMPDPSKTQILFERDGVRYVVEPEVNSAAQRPDQPEDAPVFLTARPTRQIIGAARVRILNPLRGEQGGLSEGVDVEIVDEVLPPEIISVAETTDAEMTPLRQMADAGRAAGRPFPNFDPRRRYATIRARGLDLNPRYVRIRFEQEGRRTTLAPGDFALYSADMLIVRLPEGLKPGLVQIIVENRGGDAYSTPATKTFELTR